MTNQALLEKPRNGVAASPKVLNKYRHGVPPGAIYIGRGGPWGNPFIIGRDGDRLEVIALYKAWLLRQPHLLERLHELRGRDLVCWCKPAACHGDTLLELANG